ncbi:Nonribosomal peptide synthetases (NRPS) [Penicillium taxi]|uniref:Nonribosomal peptide synthetases (NRPS) n=1 Tax=Penicillium taxi TaxID=168475 RepID=UPI00254508F2|nr:Nonribosomal peptide synthetases (NRPS) [Penicillium taxi]KAJ5885028.1 Nonribosomal peptide synthetases (NRPS) [Penicillium taxi]
MVASPGQQNLASKISPQIMLVSHGILISMPAAPSSVFTFDPELTLFIVFNSGSTGLPKGVMSSHRSFISGVHYRRSILEEPSSRVFDFASYSFDISTDIILSTLIIGECVCVPRERGLQNDIVGAINHPEVTSADLTPSVARLMNPDSVPSLKTLKFSGELSSVTDVAQ